MNTPALAARVQAMFGRVDALPQRDRWTLAAGLLALAIGAQWLLVMPTHDRRVTIESLAQADGDAQTQAAADERAMKMRQRDELQAQHLETTRQLATLGLAPTQRDSVGELIARTLTDSSVQLVGVQALPVEELTPAAADDPSVAAAVAAATDAATATTPAASDPPAPVLYRHRAEVRLEGPVPQLLEALDVVERRLSPLRIERVQLAAVPGGVQARLVLTTLSRDRHWLAL